MTSILSTASFAHWARLPWAGLLGPFLAGHEVWALRMVNRTCRDVLVPRSMAALPANYRVVLAKHVWGASLRQHLNISYMEILPQLNPGDDWQHVASVQQRLFRVTEQMCCHDILDVDLADEPLLAWVAQEHPAAWGQVRRLSVTAMNANVALQLPALVPAMGRLEELAVVHHGVSDDFDDEVSSHATVALWRALERMPPRRGWVEWTGRLDVPAFQSSSIWLDAHVQALLHGPFGRQLRHLEKLHITMTSDRQHALRVGYHVTDEGEARITALECTVAGGVEVCMAATLLQLVRRLDGSVLDELRLEGCSTPVDQALLAGIVDQVRRGRLSLRQLRVLEICGVDMGTAVGAADVLLDALAHGGRLTELLLEDVVDPVGALVGKLAALLQRRPGWVSPLRSLRLPLWRVGPTHLGAWAELGRLLAGGDLPGLKVLELVNAEIGAVGLQALFGALMQLPLPQPQDPASAAPTTALTTAAPLEELCLRGCVSADVDFLGAVLPRLPRLEVLVLSQGFEAPATVEGMGVMGALASLPALRVLDLCDLPPVPAATLAAVPWERVCLQLTTLTLFMHVDAPSLAVLRDILATHPHVNLSVGAVIGDQIATTTTDLVRHAAEVGADLVRRLTDGTFTPQPATPALRYSLVLAAPSLQWTRDAKEVLKARFLHALTQPMYEHSGPHGSLFLINTLKFVPTV